MFSALIGSVVAAATTTALSAFSEGLVTSLVVYTVAKGGAKATLSLKKQLVKKRNIQSTTTKCFFFSSTFSVLYKISDDVFL